VVESTPIHKNHFGDEAAIAIPSAGSIPHDLTEDELAHELLRSGLEGLAPFGRVDP
jgi:hypothetical protein